ncbi:MAG: hypothetical protein LKF31_10140 [Muribaculaceae bacterium]|jgi:hypothetical protein|nr:hypothetical protein [Muribaculaceae bacterium]
MTTKNLNEFGELGKRYAKRAAEQEREEVMTYEAAMNEALSTLRANGFYIDTMADLTDFTDRDKFKAYLDKQERKYLSAAYIPITERERVHAGYTRTFNDVATAIDTINSIGSYAHYDFEIKAGIFKFLQPQTDDAIKARHTSEFSPDEKEYYSMLCDIIRQVRQLQGWEKRHGWRPFSVKGFSFGTSFQGLFDLVPNFSAKVFENVCGLWFGPKSAEEIMNEETKQ